MSVSAERFRDVLRCLAGGVCIVTTRDGDGSWRGLTATAVSSVSVDPPLIVTCISSNSRTHSGIDESGAYAVSFLSAAEVELAERFAGEADDKFAGLRVSVGPSGAPLLETGLARCDCVVVDSFDAGDHTLFIGRVEAAWGRTGEGVDRPLIRYGGAWASLTAPETNGKARRDGGQG